ARIRHQRAKYRVIELVAAADRPVGAEDWPAGQREVADGIEHLVAHEFVREARAFWIENAVVADHEGVLERGAERIARIPQCGHVAHEAEGARACDLAAENVGLDVDLHHLASDQSVIEFHLRLDAETARVWPDLAKGVAHCNPYRPEHL